MNFLGGYRNTMTLVLTDLDIDEKAAWARDELFDLLGGEDQFDEVDVQLLCFDHDDATTNAGATAHLRVTVKDQDEAKVGRTFSAAVTALFLGGFAGFPTTTPPTSATSYGVYWPALIPRELVEQRVVLPDGTEQVIEHSPCSPPPRGQDHPDLVSASLPSGTSDAGVPPRRPSQGSGRVRALTVDRHTGTAAGWRSGKGLREAPKPGRARGESSPVRPSSSAQRPTPSCWVSRALTEHRLSRPAARRRLRHGWSR